MESTPIHFLNGSFTDEAGLVVPVRDLGFMRGYAVFDFLITYRGQKPFMLDRHIDRLFNSAALIGLTLPAAWTKAQVREWVMATLAKNADGREKAIKIVISGGPSHALLPEAPAPTIAILIDTREPFPDDYYTKGVGVITAKFRRYTPEAKSNNYIEGVKQAQAAAKIGAVEPVYYDEAQVYEGASSNIFAVVGGMLVTPASNILEGVTRAALLEILPAAGVPVVLRNFSMDELRGASEAFLAASNKEIMPVTAIDGVPVGDGAVGSVTKQVMEIFREFTSSDRWQ